MEDERKQGFCFKGHVMSTIRFALLAAVATLTFATATTASAQYPHFSGGFPGYHVDHHDHVIRDSHGHVIRRYHHDVLHRDSHHISPGASALQHGLYHMHNGRYYYTPPSTIGRRVVVSRPAIVTFGGFSHVDDLAARLEDQCNEFLLDLYYNYSHNPGFRETYGEAYQLYEVARYIHAAEHHQDREAMRAKLGGMDALFHHLQDDVRGWSRHHHRQVGALGILSKMELIESTLHHLMNDVGVHATPEIEGELAPVPADLTVAPRRLHCPSDRQKRGALASPVRP